MLKKIMKLEQKATQKQERAQKEILQEKEKEAQLTKDIGVKTMTENQEQQDVCTEIRRGQILENPSISGNYKITTLQLTEV